MFWKDISKGTNRSYNYILELCVHFFFAFCLSILIFLPQKYCFYNKTECSNY